MTTSVELIDIFYVDAKRIQSRRRKLRNERGNRKDIKETCGNEAL